jgi:hypothetical protein
MFYELRRRKYKTPPRTKAIEALAPHLGVTPAELLRLVCANSPAARILAAEDADAAAAGATPAADSAAS